MFFFFKNTTILNPNKEQVDAAPYFPRVFASFTEWLVEKGLLDRSLNDKLSIRDSTPAWTLLTDGSADICRFLCSGISTFFIFEKNSFLPVPLES